MVGSAEVRDQTHASLCGICFVQIDTGIGASSGTSVFLRRCHFTSDTCLYLIHLRPALCSRPWLLTALNKTLKIYGGIMATCKTKKLRGGKVKVMLKEKRVRV
jgi:hypothetical protein